MKNHVTQATLLLEDGSVYTGVAAGQIGTTSGEICFNTGMTGYQEVFTDPSYFGQVLLTTNAHIGNYGILADDDESDQIQIKGLICKNFNIDYSRPLADSDIQQYFEKNGIIAIHQIDTREIVRKIRDAGAMNVVISSEINDVAKLKAILKETPNMSGLELASKVTTDAPYLLGESNTGPKVAVLDFGTKRNILQCMVERGCQLKVYPAKTALAELKKYNPDGYFLSNGPGDPASMDYAVDTIKDILKEDKPTFGICLGHQLLALANDIPTYKMHNGHRGINHPVINLETGKCEITTQNHGFGVSPEVLEASSDRVVITHRNLNDQTIEGLKVKDSQAFSVQYHPEAAPGPHDSRYLFDSFVEKMQSAKN